MNKTLNKSFIATRLLSLIRMETTTQWYSYNIETIRIILASYERALIEEYVEWKKGKLSEVPLTIGQLKSMYEEEKDDIELFLTENR
jgi:uncharacterized protein (DUF486 family)